MTKQKLIEQLAMVKEASINLGLSSHEQLLVLFMNLDLMLRLMWRVCA